MTAVRATRPDEAAPSVRRAARDVLVRAVLPAVPLFAVVLALGLAITGPLRGLPAEQTVNRSLAAHRTPTLDTLSGYGTLAGSTVVIIAATLVAMSLVAGLSRRWWWAIAPGIAVTLELVVFLGVAAIVSRPRPNVPHLDQAPPTSSYPSGHTGASTALWFSLALLAQRIRATWLRVVVTAICVLVPLAVGWSRLYRGMHHVTDVVVGLLVGAACAGLASRSLRELGTTPAGPLRQTRAYRARANE